ncbi:MAG: HU family DNA-binding protein [Bacteroides sp.]|nr:HU family DNA-binding protein [Bacteroides sp.]
MDNKTLIDTLSKKLGITRGDVESLISGMTRVMGECGSELDTINITGFGSFESKKRMERVALHPASGKRLMIPPKIVMTFKPSAPLKQKVRKGGAGDGK